MSSILCGFAFTYYDRLCPVVAACVNVVLSTCCEHYEEVDEGGYAVTVGTSCTIASGMGHNIDELCR